MQNLRKQLANELANDCKTVTDVRNAVNSLFKAMDCFDNPTIL